MAEITSMQVKKLREETGAGMMDCKKALVETNGDFQEAVDWLRKKGLSAAAKKSGRVAAEGLVAVTVSGNKGALIELNSETDFVARNDKFQTLVRDLAQYALQANGDLETLKNVKTSSGKTVSETLTEAIATIGENMTLRRTAALEAKTGIVASYMHGAVAPGLGKIGVLVALESTTAQKAELEALGKQLAMHIAASNPQALTADSVSPELLKREQALYVEQASGFEKKFNEFAAKMEPFKANLGAKRNFSEKQVEAKLEELMQFSQSYEELYNDFKTKSASEDKKDKQDAEKIKKLLDVFHGEAAYMLERIGGYAQSGSLTQKLTEIKTARFYEDSVLADQLFVIDGKSKISAVLEQAGKDLGAPVSIANFVRLQIGEGIEKQQTDFAAEVAAAANG